MILVILIEPGMSIRLWHNCGKPQFVVVFPPKIVLWLWCSLSKNCGRGWGLGWQNSKIVVEGGDGVVILGKTVLGLGLGLSLLEKLCWGCQSLETWVGIGVVVLFSEKIVLWFWLWCSLLKKCGYGWGCCNFSLIMTPILTPILSYY